MPFLTWSQWLRAWRECHWATACLCDPIILAQWVISLGPNRVNRTPVRKIWQRWIKKMNCCTQFIIHCLTWGLFSKNGTANELIPNDASIPVPDSYNQGGLTQLGGCHMKAEGLIERGWEGVFPHTGLLGLEMSAPHHQWHPYIRVWGRKEVTEFYLVLVFSCLHKWRTRTKKLVKKTYVIFCLTQIYSLVIKKEGRTLTMSHHNKCKEEYYLWNKN